MSTGPLISEEKLDMLRAGLPPGTNIWISKGEFLSGETTAMVELLSSGDVLKRPNKRHDPDIDDDNVRNILIEAQIYDALGEHRRLAKFKGLDLEEHEICLEYLPNGRLDKYLESHRETSIEQRLHWVDQAIESLELLHAADVIHCDFGPHNLLLDQDLDLRITDFAGSSFRGSHPWVAGADGYWLPDPDPKHPARVTQGNDLFALGSTIYYIFTGHDPFEGLEGEAKNDKFRNAQFPDMTATPCKDLAEGCWLQSIQSIQKVRQEFQEYLAAWKTHGE